MPEHIKIGDLAPRVQYVADGAQGAFTYPFPIFAEADLEVYRDGVRAYAGFAVSGAGASEGGAVVFAAPPAPGTGITLRRRLDLLRTTDFQENGILRARVLNDELDYQIAALQELREDVAGAVRLDPSEVGGSTVLPLRAGRANKLLGFDAVGNVTAYDRGATVSLPYPGAVPRAVEDKLAERLSARDFGAVGDGVADDGAALQAAMTAAATAGKHLVIGEGTFRSARALVLPGAAAGLTMRGLLLYAGPAGQPALTLGDGGAARNASKLYDGLRVQRAAQSDWGSEGDIGLLLRNLDACQVEVRQAEGFTIGVRTLGDGRGFEDTTLVLGRIANNKVGLDVRTGTAAGWNNGVRYLGGHFAVASAVNPGVDRFGVRFSLAPGAYALHNAHHFQAPDFELARGTGYAAIPFLNETNGRAVVATGIRMEACDAYVARHTAAAQDCLYEVAYAGTWAYRLDVDYAGATRAGAVVRTAHQSLAQTRFTRVVASAPGVRARAFVWKSTAGEVGFEGLCCMAGNPLGTPGAIGEFAFRGLDTYGMNADSVTIPGSRGLGFAVRTSGCRDFALAVDGDNARVFVQCFDAGNAVLTAAGSVLSSTGSMTLDPVAKWFIAGANLSDELLNRLMAVRLSAAVAYAIIGVCRVDADVTLRGMTLLCPPEFAPAHLNGTPLVPAGSRSLAAELAWDPPAIAAGGTAQLNVPVADAVPGDFAQAAYTLATSGAVFLAQIGATGVVTVTVLNRTAAALDLNPGVVRVRVVKA